METWEVYSKLSEELKCTMKGNYWWVRSVNWSYGLSWLVLFGVTEKAKADGTFPGSYRGVTKINSQK